MNESDLRIADNLRFLRMYSGASQEQIASAAGVSRNMYVRYEAGLSVPSIDKINALARFFEVSVDTLTERDLPAASRSDITGITPRSVLKDIIGNYESLSIISRKVIIEEVHMLQDMERKLYG